MSQRLYEGLLRELLGAQQDNVRHGYFSLSKAKPGGHLQISLPAETEAAEFTYLPSANTGINGRLTPEDCEFPFNINPGSLGISAAGSHLEDTLEHILPSWMDAGYNLDTARFDRFDGVAGVLALYNQPDAAYPSATRVEAKPSLLTNRGAVEACCRDYGIALKYSS